MQFFTEIKKWLGEITEILLLLIAVAVAAEILFGSTTFFGGVVGNLTQLIGTLGEDGLVGLIALSIIFYLFYRRKPATTEHHG